MGKITIEGVPGLDGDYDYGELEMGDYRTLGEVTGLYGLREIADASENWDPRLLVGLAAVALKKSGKDLTPAVLALLWATRPGQIFDSEEPEADVDPPADGAATPGRDISGSSTSNAAETPTTDSSVSSDGSPEPTPDVTGTQA